MLGGVDVTAPDGTAWRVGRRWTSRSVRWPPRRRRERERDFGDGDGWLDFDFPDLCDVGDDFLGGIALAVRDGATGPARTWKVVGWRRSGRHVMDVAGAIASGRALPPGA